MKALDRLSRAAGPAAIVLMLLGLAASSAVAQTAPMATATPALSSSDVAAATPAKTGLPGKVIEKVKAVATRAGDIFNRVPCLPPKGVAPSVGSLPHVAAKLAANKPVVIVAFGSSSTEGYGSTAPEFTYPNRLAAQSHRKYPKADIAVPNQIGRPHV